LTIITSRKNLSSNDKNVFAVSANMAYGEVTLNSKTGLEEDSLGLYENPDKILRTASMVTYEPTHSGKPETLECAGMEDTVGTNN
jgi:hypothetical protein